MPLCPAVMIVEADCLRDNCQGLSSSVAGALALLGSPVAGHRRIRGLQIEAAVERPTGCRWTGFTRG
jgi:hypothetical protein